MENHSQVVMLVAIVAVAGLFALTDGFSGAAAFRTATPRDSNYQIGAEPADAAVGHTIGYECSRLAAGNTNYCCSQRCETFCGQKRYGDELAQSICFDACDSACTNRLREIASR